MKKLLIIFSLLFCLTSCISTQSNLNQKLPFSTEITKGKLNNGLTYVIMNNPEPKNRVYIRLVVNAGSLNEDDDQKGVAHLVEHMAFNGSKSFPKNQIINALEQLGMKFARDINAFTDFENTVYTLNLDTNNSKNLELAFNVLNEWIHYLTILPEDVDNERGIVEEEWRRRLSPTLHLGDKKSAIELAGSRYLQRDPIGDMNIIRHISSQRVADFYHKWYRPDNMSLIIVGDINQNDVITLLKQKLNIENPRTKTPLEKVDYSIPLINDWRFATVAEKGINTPAVEFSWLQTIKEENTLAEYKQAIVYQILTRLINLRLQKWEKENNQDLIDSANFFRTHIGRETLQSIFIVQLNKTNYQNSLQALFQFIAEIKQHGFTQIELEQEIERLVKANEKQLSIRSGSLKIADDLIAYVANNQIIISEKDKYNLNKSFLNQITLQDINQAFAQMYAIKSKLVLITQPYPAKHLNLSLDKIKQIWQQVQNTTQKNWVNQQHQVAMPVLNIQSGKIEKEKYWKKGDITEYRLSNGSKLIYHYSDKTPNQVFFKAITTGGLRSVAKQDYNLFRTAITVTDDSGIGPLSLDDINHLFSQSPIAFATVVDDYKQGFTAVGKSDQLENLLKLFRLKLQGTAVSKSALEIYQKDTRNYFKQVDKDTEFMQQVSKLRYPNIPTVYNQNKQELLSFQAEQLTKFYNQHILNNTDFTYFILGDIPPRKVEKLAKKYLASVIVKKQPKKTYQVTANIPHKPFIMHGVNENRAEVEIYLTANNQWTPELQYQLDILSDILQEKLRLILREKESGVYAVSSWFSQNKGDPQIEGKIEFTCSPERANFLIRQTNQVLNQIIKDGVDPQLLNKKISEKQAQIKYQFDTLISISSIIENSFWNTGKPDSIYLYQYLEQLANKQNIDKLAKKILDKSSRFETILEP